MGLSSFNAMRARAKAEAKALGDSSAEVKVNEVKPDRNVEVPDEKPAKKTDAEKLKNKKG